MVKVAISYRVLQAWRVPVFSKLAKKEGIDLLVLHGESFQGSKVVNYSEEVDFDTAKLRTCKLRIVTSNGPAYIPLNLGLWSALRSFQPDVIITEGASNALNNLICFVYARLYSKKIAQWGLGQIRGRKVSRARWAVNRLFFDLIERRSDAAISYSSYGAAYYGGVGIPKDRVYVAVNTVDTEARQEKAREYAMLMGRDWPSGVPKRFNVLFVGALTANKNIDMLLKAFAEFASKRTDTRLTVVGDGSFRHELERISQELGIETQTHFAGHVDEGIAQFFMDATVMVLPGLGGLAVSDALCHGVPVMCGIGDGSEADLIDGSNGVIIEPMDQANLVTELVRLYDDRSLQELWRQNAPRIIAEKYNINNYVEALERCISDLGAK